MYQGTSLQAIAEEVKRQAAAKVDYVAPASRCEFALVQSTTLYPDGDPTKQVVGFAIDDKLHRVRQTAHSQLASFMGIPKKYYDRMAIDAPHLLRDAANHWLRDKEHAPKSRLVRTLDGDVRAFLSDRYRPLDNVDFLQAMLPAVMECGCEVRSCQLTEDRLFLKVVDPTREETIMPAGAVWGVGHDSVDVVQPGLVLSNSEVGNGSLSLQPAVHTVKCTNLATFRENAATKTHLGRALGNGDDNVRKYLTDETRRREDFATWSKLKDLAKASLDGAIFDDLVAKLPRAKECRIEEDVQGAVERVANHFDIGAREQTLVLDELIAGADRTQYGVHAAITRASQKLDAYEQATTLEEVGGRVIDLTPDQFVRISTDS
jgi:hypothetical protein